MKQLLIKGAVCLVAGFLGCALGFGIKYIWQVDDAKMVQLRAIKPNHDYKRGFKDGQANAYEQMTDHCVSVVIERGKELTPYGGLLLCSTLLDNTIDVEPPDDAGALKKPKAGV